MDLSPRTTVLACQVHKSHTPRSHINEKHHIWPQGRGGPTVAENLVVVCATGHNNIHTAMDALYKHKGDVPAGFWRTFTAEERRLAELGYQRSIDQHL